MEHIILSCKNRIERLENIFGVESEEKDRSSGRSSFVSTQTNNFFDWISSTIDNMNHMTEMTVVSINDQKSSKASLKAKASSGSYIRLSLSMS